MRRETNSETGTAEAGTENCSSEFFSQGMQLSVSVSVVTQAGMSVLDLG